MFWPIIKCFFKLWILATFESLEFDAATFLHFIFYIVPRFEPNLGCDSSELITRPRELRLKFLNKNENKCLFYF